MNILLRFSPFCLLLKLLFDNSYYYHCYNFFPLFNFVFFSFSIFSIIIAIIFYILVLFLLLLFLSVLILLESQ